MPLPAMLCEVVMYQGVFDSEPSAAICTGVNQPYEDDSLVSLTVFRKGEAPLFLKNVPRDRYKRVI